MRDCPLSPPVLQRGLMALVPEASWTFDHAEWLGGQRHME